MIARAAAAGVPFRWVAADSVYGVGDIEGDLRQGCSMLYTSEGRC
jgi:SRSO17 transposase